MCMSNTVASTPPRSPRRWRRAAVTAFVGFLLAGFVAAGIAVVVHATAAAVFGAAFLVTVATLAGSQVIRRRWEAAVWRSVHQDRLTGLPDRAVAEQILDAAHWAGSTLAIALADVDVLGAVNTMAGYEAGDRYLCAVATRLAAGAPPGTVVARLGGDDFVVIAPGRQANTLAAAVTAALAEPGPVAGTLMLRASVGVAAGSDAPRVVLARADAALSTAKRTGNQVLVYDCDRDGWLVSDGPRPTIRRRDRRPADAVRWVPDVGAGSGWLVCSPADLVTMVRALRTARDWWAGVLAGTGSVAGQPTPTAQEAMRHMAAYRDLATRIAAVAGDPT
jgi:diguanylate cyclase (GGDEF)-like protein